MASDWFEDDDTDLDDAETSDDPEEIVVDNKLTKQQKVEIRRKLEDMNESKRLKALIDDYYDFDLDDE